MTIWQGLLTVWALTPNNWPQDKIGTRSPYQTQAARSILYEFGSVILESAFNGKL